MKVYRVEYKYYPNPNGFKNINCGPYRTPSYIDFVDTLVPCHDFDNHPCISGSKYDSDYEVFAFNSFRSLFDWFLADRDGVKEVLSHDVARIAVYEVPSHYVTVHSEGRQVTVVEEYMELIETHDIDWIEK